MRKTIDLLRIPGQAWKEYVHPRFAALQQREQRLLVAAAIALPLFVLVFVYWLPMRDEAQAIRAALPAMQVEQAEARMLADKIAREGAGKAVRGDLLSRVDAAARDVHIRQYITRIKPQPGFQGQAVLMQLRNAPYADTLRFAGLMAGQGVGTERARLSRGNSPGLVNLDITFATR